MSANEAYERAMAEGREDEESARRDDPDYDPRPSRDNLGMMRRADLWPTRPVLHLKRQLAEGDHQFGFLVKDTDGEHALTAVFVQTRSEGAKVLEDYESLEELAGDGWEVD